eukprot:CAMPEP_0114569258 /NCGR_PEP_ID=MMETSP0114-20121206/16524_1 /TAXON_ID=31324 /ORGANISM="Goniomonas sp, Strain m" /LENGTH=57 /DNA_ID=CAMNT_0001756113 /DNA_START=19 /DNA_END=189 /DNA_ORIENTATION=+
MIDDQRRTALQVAKDTSMTEIFMRAFTKAKVDPTHCSAVGPGVQPVIEAVETVEFVV